MKNQKDRISVASKIKNLVLHPLFTGSAVMIVGTNLGNFFAYLFHLIIGRMLGPVGYGELASVISLVGFFSITFGFLSLVIVKFVSSMKPDEVPAFFSWITKWSLIAAAIVSILILIGSGFIKDFLNISASSAVIASPILFVLFMGLIYSSFLQGLLRFNQLVATTVLGLLSRLILGVLFVYIGFAVFGALAGVLLSSILGLGISIFLLRDFWHKNKKSFSFKRSREVFSYALPIFVMSVATNSMYTTDVVLVKHFFDPHLAGIYASLATMGKIIFYGTAPISAVMFPLAARTFTRGGNHKKVFFMSILLTSLVIFGLVILYWAFPGLVLNILYGGKFIEGAPYLVWFGIFIGLFALAALTLNYFLSKGNTKVVYLALAAALAQVVGIWLFHGSIMQVVSVSIWASLILLISLLIYFAYEANFGRDSGLQG